MSTVLPFPLYRRCAREGCVNLLHLPDKAWADFMASAPSDLRASLEEMRLCPTPCGGDDA